MHGSSSFLVQKGWNFRATSGENHLDHVLARSKQTPFFLPEDIQVKQNRRHASNIRAEKSRTDGMHGELIQSGWTDCANLSLLCLFLNVNEFQPHPILVGLGTTAAPSRFQPGHYCFVWAEQR
jgi:hypothetical protein